MQSAHVGIKPACSAPPPCLAKPGNCAAGQDANNDQRDDENDGEDAAWPQDADALGRERVRIGNVLEDVPQGDEVVPICRQGKIEQIALVNRQTMALACNARPLRRDLGALELEMLPGRRAEITLSGADV